MTGPAAAGGAVPPPVAFEDVPAVYVRWRRVDYPRMTEGAIAEGWRWKTDAEREFWTRLAPPPRRVPELGAVAYEAAETGALRDLVAEILGAIEAVAEGVQPITAAQLAKWHERAGLEDS